MKRILLATLIITILYGCEKEKIEYSTLSELATKNDMSISQVKKIISEDK